jgi:hypothetical protein
MITNELAPTEKEWEAHDEYLEKNPGDFSGALTLLIDLCIIREILETTNVKDFHNL